MNYDRNKLEEGKEGVSNQLDLNINIYCVGGDGFNFFVIWLNIILQVVLIQIVVDSFRSILLHKYFLY